MLATERFWSALTSMVKLQDKVTRHNDVIRDQQAKIESLTERMIKVETILELLMRAGDVRTLK